MKKTVLFIDLDNTIYPVSSIGNELFKLLFDLIEDSGEFEGDFEAIKTAVQRKPFQKVAELFQFSDQLVQDGLNLLETLVVDHPIQPFDDYEVVRTLPHDKFLVTSGFTTMQNSKVDQLGIREDFREIHIVDLQKSSQTKRDVFENILNRFDFTAEDVLVIGDDPNSEIQAGKQLGIDTILYDQIEAHADYEPRITNFHQLVEILE
jgi:putative hydrolase of the HAD superfamily